MFRFFFFFSFSFSFSCFFPSSEGRSIDDNNSRYYDDLSDCEPQRETTIGFSEYLAINYWNSERFLFFSPPPHPRLTGLVIRGRKLSIASTGDLRAGMHKMVYLVYLACQAREV